MITSPAREPWSAPETIGDGIKRLLDLARLIRAVIARALTPGVTS